MRKITGKKIAMIFQEPMTSLNPVLRIGKQIGEVLRTHEKMTRREKKQRILELLIQVGIGSPEKCIRDYPHQFSGGMRQRVMIAMALACKPDLLIADEPTTALDVTVQAHNLEIIKQINRTEKMAVLMITHDLSVIAEMAQKVIVMYAGQIVEQAPVSQLFKSPLHPYTQGLLNSVPGTIRPGESLFAIRGTVPGVHAMPKGCRFSNRCDYCREICEQIEPAMQQITEDRMVRCWKEKRELENR